MPHRYGILQRYFRRRPLVEGTEEICSSQALEAQGKCVRDDAGSQLTIAFPTPNHGCALVEPPQIRVLIYLGNDLGAGFNACVEQGDG